MIGVFGLSLVVGTFVIALITSRSFDALHLPKTGCLDGPGENQSKLALSATLMKNCEPPLFGDPVLAIDSVPGALVSLEMFSSLMLPPLERLSVPPVFKFLKVPSGGLPVPALLDIGSPM